jgi:DNA-binding ferritin-like protein
MTSKIKTKNNKLNKNKTTLKNHYFKNKSSIKPLVEFQNEITIIFFEMLLMIKLFHWNTYSYSTHKATDDLYDKINENMDKFMEVLLGKTLHRINLSNIKSIKLIDFDANKEKLITKINDIKSYLVSLDNYPKMKTMSNSDLYNIRDELMGDFNQFLYLLTLE